MAVALPCFTTQAAPMAALCQARRCQAFQLCIHRQPMSIASGAQRRRFAPRLIRCQSSGASQAAEALQRGKDRYEAEDRMGALRHFESVLKKNPSPEEKQAALFNATCVHAGFGDVEVAQLTLRDAVTSGLEFEQALKNPDLLKMNAPPQVMIQLKKFAETVKKVRAAVSPQAALKVPPPGKEASTRRSLFEQDVSATLRTDITDMDASALGIVKRVAALLVIAIVGGTAIFYLGLYLAFGDIRK